MSQAKLVKIFEKNPKKWFTTVELAEKVGNGKSCCARSLTKLINQKLIVRKTERKNRVFYKLK